MFNTDIYFSEGTEYTNESQNELVLEIANPIPKKSAQKTFDVILFHQQENVKEYIPNVVLNSNQNGDIELKGLIRVLDSMGLLFGPSMFYYYSYVSEMYIYCGQDPIPSSSTIPERDILNYNDRRVINLKIRLADETLLQKSDFQLGDDIELQAATYIDIPSTTHSSESDKDWSSNDGEDKKRRTRHKERKIGEVLELVLKWRKLYAGCRDPVTGLIMKLSLEEAAKKLGVAKKSLDDYLLQIRHANLYGFDFQLNNEERIGVLRAFVKKNRNSVSSSETSIFEDDDHDCKRVAKSKLSKRITRSAIVA